MSTINKTLNIPFVKVAKSLLVAPPLAAKPKKLTSGKSIFPTFTGGKIMLKNESSFHGLKDNDIFHWQLTWETLLKIKTYAWTHTPTYKVITSYWRHPSIYNKSDKVFFRTRYVNPWYNYKHSNSTLLSLLRQYFI